MWWKMETTPLKFNGCETLANPIKLCFNKGGGK